MDIRRVRRWSGKACASQFHDITTHERDLGMSPGEMRKLAESYRMQAQQIPDTEEARHIIIRVANEIVAKFYETIAEVEENGGVAQCWGLFDKNGSRVAAKIVRGRFGDVWSICANNGKKTSKFVPMCIPAKELEMLRNEDREHFGESLKKGTRRYQEREEYLLRKVAEWEEKYGFSQIRETVPVEVTLDGRFTTSSLKAVVNVTRKDNGNSAGEIVLRSSKQRDGLSTP